MIFWDFFFILERLVFIPEAWASIYIGQKATVFLKWSVSIGINNFLSHYRGIGVSNCVCVGDGNPYSFKVILIEGIEEFFSEVLQIFMKKSGWYVKPAIFTNLFDSEKGTRNCIIQPLLVMVDET